MVRSRGIGVLCRAAAVLSVCHVLLQDTRAAECTSCQHCYACSQRDHVGSWGKPLARQKDTFFQLWETEASWTGPDADFELTEASTFLRVAVPLDGTTDNVLALQPGIRTYFLNGPGVIDVPEKLYDAQLNIVWRKEFSARWQTNVWVQPKVRSDFETSDDSFFLSGGAYAKYRWKPDLFDLYLGAFYLDRDDISVLPAVGFVWTPTYDWRVEALLPRPKIAHRLSASGGCEKWAYLSGQLGGGSFAVQRAAGGADKVTIRDLRLFAGVESVRQGGGGLFR